MVPYSAEVVSQLEGATNGFRPLQFISGIQWFLDDSPNFRKNRGAKKPIVTRRAEPREKHVVVTYTGARGQMRAYGCSDEFDLATMDRLVHEAYSARQHDKWVYEPTELYKPDSKSSDTRSEVDVFLADERQLYELAVKDSDFGLARQVLDEIERHMRVLVKELAEAKKKDEEATESSWVAEEMVKKVERLLAHVDATQTALPTTGQEFQRFLTILVTSDGAFTNDDCASLVGRITSALEPEEIKARFLEVLDPLRQEVDAVQEQIQPYRDEVEAINRRYDELEAAIRTLTATDRIQTDEYRRVFDGIGKTTDNWLQFCRKNMELTRAATDIFAEAETLLARMQQLASQIEALEVPIRPQMRQLELLEEFADLCLKVFATRPVRPFPNQVVPINVPWRSTTFGIQIGPLLAPPSPIAPPLVKRQRAKPVWLGLSVKNTLSKLDAMGTFYTVRSLKRLQTFAENQTYGWGYKKLIAERARLLDADINVYSVLNCLHEAEPGTYKVTLYDFVVSKLGNKSEDKKLAEAFVKAVLYGLETEWELLDMDEKFPIKAINEELRDFMIDGDANWQTALQGIDVWSMIEEEDDDEGAPEEKEKESKVEETS